MNPLRIAMWSGPRNVSTAMMRSFENRVDTEVIDEPFYAYYLAKTQSPHPMYDEVLASQSNKYSEVVQQLTHGQCHAPIQYQKHMTHHMLANEDLSWTKQLRNCFLIREPAEVVFSYTKSRGECSVEDIGIIRQQELYDELTSLTGQTIPIIEGKDILQNPQIMLTCLCEALDIPFDKNMLAWPAGMRQSDGIWASHWYHNVARSTGFAEPQVKEIKLTEAQQKVVEQVTPAYQYLSKLKLRL